jgi:hypothetical protein
MTEPDIAAVMQASMNAEDKRRQLASMTPGLGAQLNLPDVPYGPSVGKSGLDLPPVGEGLETSPVVVPRLKAYGPQSPVYADDLVGGLGYSLGSVHNARRHVTDLGADGLFIEPGPDGRAPTNSMFVVSPAAPRPSLWQRLTSRLRRK